MCAFCSMNKQYVRGYKNSKSLTSLLWVFITKSVQWTEIKSHVLTVQKTWTQRMVIRPAPLKCMVTKTLTKARQEDLARGKWCLRREEIKMWFDASSLATGLVLEIDGTSLKLRVDCNQTETLGIKILLNGHDAERRLSGSPMESNTTAAADRLNVCTDESPTLWSRRRECTQPRRC